MVVAFHGGVEAAADFVEVVGETHDAVVELAAEGADFVGVFRDGFLAPAEGGGFEEGDERRRRGEEHAAGEGAVHEAGVGGERGGEEMIAGQKEDDELGRGLKLLPIVFRAEGVDVAADFLRVVGKAGGAGGFVGGVDGGAVGFERGLGIDDDALAAREAHDEIGAEAAGRGGFLLGKIAVGEHVGHLDDAAELEFAPTAGEGGGAEGGGEFAGFGLELELGGAEIFELLGEGAVGGGAGFFDVGDFAVHFFEGLAEGFDEGVDGELAFVEVAGGLLLEVREGLLGLFEKVGAVGAEGVGGEGFEFADEALVRGAFGVEVALGAGELGGELVAGGAEGGEFSGEAAVFLLARGDAVGERGVAAAQKEPDEEAGEGGGENDGGGEIHGKILSGGGEITQDALLDRVKRTLQIRVA